MPFRGHRYETNHGVSHRFYRVALWLTAGFTVLVLAAISYEIVALPLTDVSFRGIAAAIVAIAFAVAATSAALGGGITSSVANAFSPTLAFFAVTNVALMAGSDVEAVRGDVPLWVFFAGLAAISLGIGISAYAVGALARPYVRN